MKLIELNKRPLKKGKKKGFFAKVDDSDFEWLNKWQWSVSNNKGYCYYAVRRSSKMNDNSKMHRVIMGAKKHQKIDHIDGDGLNNQRRNLRVATATQNMGNRRKKYVSTSKYKGVYWEKDDKKWRVAVTFNGKRFYCGKFNNEEDAAKAYNKKAKELYGKFANLNIISKTKKLK